VRQLERYTQRFLPEDLELYFDDIVDATERIWDLLDNYKEVVEALEQTNESVISHRQQYRLQILTVFSVIFLPLTLLSGIFGMNWGFSTAGFIVTVSAMAALFLLAIAVFRWRRWL
jgi:magnesium transporter